MNPWTKALPSIMAGIFLFSGCRKITSDGTATTESAAAEAAETTAFSHANGKPYKKPREFIPGPELAGKTSKDPEYALAWHRFTTVEEYKRIGRKNAAWDDAVVMALEAYASLLSRDEALEGEERIAAAKLVATPTAKAIDAGCDDPLVRYVHAIFVLGQSEGRTAEMLSRAFGAAADALGASDYPSIRKAFAYYRATVSDFEANGRPGKMRPRSAHLVRSSINYLCESLFDTNMPPQSAYSAAREIEDEFDGSTVGRFDLYESLVPTLQKYWKDHAFAQYIIGCIYVAKAWEARGDGWARTVDEASWKLMSERLESAEKHLLQSHKMDPTDWRVPVKMIRVIMTGSGERSEMEKWFDRAMALDRNCYDAAWAKTFYLEPRWHGDEDDAMEFARQCVRSEKWGGHVPLVLPRLHASLQAYYKIDQSVYYSDSRVWEDIQSAYKRFFELNPEAVSHRHNYARDAFRCGQYKVFLEQLPLFKTGTNFGFFGSRAGFFGMVQFAQSKVGETESKP